MKAANRADLTTAAAINFSTSAFHILYATCHATYKPRSAVFVN